MNTSNVDALGQLGADQLDFVRRDVARLAPETPMMVFTHIPLFAVYPKWGLSTDDAVMLLALFRRSRP